jgi:hypothetical protein
LKYGEYDQLVNLTCDPRHYQTSGDFADDYLVTSVMGKSINLPLAAKPMQAALATWHKCQVINRETNARFESTSYVDHPQWWPKYVDYLRRILGPLGPREFSEILSLCKHGPGAVAGVQGTLVTSEKFDMINVVTKSLLPFADEIMGESWGCNSPNVSSVNPPRLIEWDEFFTVRKNAKTDRGCAKGPMLNTYYQLGIGSYLMKRLRFFGVDLKTQVNNQVLARLAGDWQLATIDLSTASELMASTPTLQALPDRWGHLFDIARTKVTKLRPMYTETGKPELVAQEKFCAMGNGFTFPLQTAMFLSVVRAIVPSEMHGLTIAYGDDIICPQRYALEVCTALEYLGFRVNHQKTCLAGRFFESCGTDWFDSQNVRPFFLRRDPESDIPYSVQAANQLRAWSIRRASISGKEGSDARFHRIWKSLVAQAPYPWAVPVPPALGDTGYCCDYSEVADWENLTGNPARAIPHSHIGSSLPGSFGLDGAPLSTQGWEGFSVRHVKISPEKVDRRSYGVLLSGMDNSIPRERMYDTSTPAESCFRQEVAQCGGRESPRGARTKLRLGWASVPCWPDNIGWCAV